MKIEIEVSDALPQSGQLRDLFDQVVMKIASLMVVAWHDGAIYGLDKVDKMAQKHFDGWAAPSGFIPEPKEVENGR